MCIRDRFLSVDETLFSSISDTEHGQGIILIVKKREYNTDNLLEKLDGKYVYLDTIQDPGNLGTIIRTSAAAGCAGIDVYKRQAILFIGWLR